MEEFFPDGSRNEAGSYSFTATRPDWSSRAACGGPATAKEVAARNALFIPGINKEESFARATGAAALCEYCPVQAECVAYTPEPVQVVIRGNNGKGIMAVRDNDNRTGQHTSRAVGVDLESLGIPGIAFGPWKRTQGGNPVSRNIVLSQ